MEGLKEILESGQGIDEMVTALSQFIESGFVAKNEFDSLEGEYQSCVAKYDDFRKQSAVDMAIMEAKGKNKKAIKALIDMEGISLEEDGSVKGLDLEAIKESDGYLFDVEEVTTKGTGFTRGTGVQEMGINSEIAKAMGIKN